MSSPLLKSIRAVELDIEYLKKQIADLIKDDSCIVKLPAEGLPIHEEPMAISLVDDSLAVNQEEDK